MAYFQADTQTHSAWNLKLAMMTNQLKALYLILFFSNSEISVFSDFVDYELSENNRGIKQFDLLTLAIFV